MPDSAPAPTLATRLLFAIAVTFSLFQVWTAAYSPLSSLVVRSVHVGFLLLLSTLPASLYFATVFWMVHLEAGRAGLHGLPKGECPNAWTAVKDGGHLLLPLAGLVFLLFSGYTPLFAGTVSLALTVVLILGTAVSAAVSVLAVRVGFWVVVALLCSAFFKFGIGWVIPFMAVYDPALLAQGDSTADMVYMVFKALCAVALWGVASIGYLWGPVTLAGRVLGTAAAFLLVVATWWSDAAGFALGSLFLAWELAKRRRALAA